MSDSSSYDQTSSINLNLKHRIEVVNLDDPDCQKTAINYLLHKVQHNESLMVAVAKEYKNLNDEVRRLYELNDNLAAENVTLKEVLQIQEDKLRRSATTKDLEEVRNTLVDGKKMICEVENEISLMRESHEELIENCKQEISVLENQLSGVFGVLNDEMDIMKSSCKDCKDEISDALISDLKDIKSWFDEQFENLEASGGVVVDESYERKLDQFKHQIAKIENDIHALQLDVGKSQYKSRQITSEP